MKMTQSPDEKIKELKQATRAANEVLAELKDTLKDVKKARDEISKLLESAFEDQIASVVSDTLASYKESIDKAIDDATQAVFDRFETISKTLLGETKEARRKHGMSVPESILDNWCVRHKAVRNECGCVE